MRFFTKTVGIILVFFAGSALAGDMPDKIVQDAAKEIQDLLKKNHAAYSDDHKKLYAMVHEKVLPYFDFGAMSKLVLATNWKTANEGQRERFTIAFRDLLVRTYATAFLKYTDDKIVFLPFHGKPGDRKVMVDAEIRPASGGPAIPMSYRFYFNKQGQWKVYDVSIDGVSLVINYRSVYAEKIQKEGLDALIASIEKEDPNGELPSSKAATANKS